MTKEERLDRTEKYLRDNVTSLLNAQVDITKFAWNFSIVYEEEISRLEKRIQNMAERIANI